MRWIQNRVVRGAGLLRLRVPAFAGRVRVGLGAGRARDKKFFVRVTECWPSACESKMNKKFNATERFRYKDVVTFSSGELPQIGVSSSRWFCQKYVLGDGN